MSELYSRKLIEQLLLGNTLSKEQYQCLLHDRTQETEAFVFAAARHLQHRHYGNRIFIRGLIECTNYCKNDCYYCGIRRSNKKTCRYRMSDEEILHSCHKGYELGFRTFVLQGGEDPLWNDEKIICLIEKIKDSFRDCALTLSLGEREKKSYQSYYNAGADRYLLRHETADAKHYARLHPPEMISKRRKQCLWDLKEIGYQVGTGIMVGSPDQTEAHLAEDLLFIQQLQPHMVGIGPFLSHQDTPFSAFENGSMEQTLYLLGILRIMLPKALIPATTALGTIHPQGREKGILAGANVLMPNLSPKEIRQKYILYDNKLNTGMESAEGLEHLKKRMNAIGYEITSERGDCKDYIRKQGEKSMYRMDSLKAEEFINHQEILDTLKYAGGNRSNRELIDQILKKARRKEGLNHQEAMVLLDCDIEEKNEEIFQLAKQIKQDLYGNRIVMFAPLYLSNYCVNGCVYCPYHAKNKQISRKKLTQEEIRREVIALQDMGHKRLVLEAGEDPVHNPIDYITESIKTIYSIKHKNGVIRRVNINIAATTVENYRRLKDAGIGTYILFQETYHKESYEKLHPNGPKHDYNYHTEAMDRAMEGGLDDVGIGVLFGLERYRYEFAGLLMHAEHLEAVHGVGPHTISVPRIRNAEGIDKDSFHNGISDDVFEKLVACIRIAVPYTGMIVSTRESEHCRERILQMGISQISGGSKTSVGGYAQPESEADNSAQFDISDNRTLDEIVNWLIRLGYIPSFCTACYREGRTGDRFMSLCKSGQILNCCHPNSLMTLKEYLEDYASEDTKEIGYDLISKEVGHVPSEKVREIVSRNLQEIEEGKRDFRF